MQFRILGSLEFADGDGAISLDAPKQRALLGVLLLYPNEVVSTNRLIDELWGEHPPATAVKVVQTYVSQLRRGLGPDVIETRPPGYLLRVEEDALDADRFRRLTGEGRLSATKGNQQRADGLFREALALWRGPPLADVTFESFARSEVERLEEERLDVLTDRIDCELALGRHHELTSELESHVKQHPLRERFRAQLMLALYRSGRQADALSAYQDARRTLVDELGLEPGRELRDLEQAILRHDTALEAPVAPREVVGVHGRRGVLAAVPVVGVAVLLALALSSVFGSGSEGLSSVRPNAVGIIDPGSNRIVGEVAVGVGPEAVAVGTGSVWAANTEDETVSRIDPVTRRLVRTISVDGYPGDLAIDRGSVWVALGPLAMLSRIAGRKATRPIPAVGEDLGCRRPNASLVASDRDLWFACGTGEVSRVDPRSRKIMRVAYDAGLLTSSSALLPEFSDLAFGLGSIWLANRAANTVTEIDPSTNRPLQTITVGPAPTALATALGSLWVANFDDDTVWRVEIPRRLKPITHEEIDVGDGPVDVAFGRSAVWVANSLDGTVSRIDPRRNAVVETIRVGNEPRRLAVGEGAVWVTVQAPRKGTGR